MDKFESEIASGKRFYFGKNWRSFLSTLDENRIITAENSLKEMLGIKDLYGKSFLDIGSGSGLFSLAAKRLGANVVSFDFDHESVNCTSFLKDKYFPGDNSWSVFQGSILDKDLIKTIGTFDIVYSWGVLHHTGNIMEALENVIGLLQPSGKLFIAIYNDQGFISKFWWNVKNFYCSGKVAGIVTLLVFFPYFFLKFILACFLSRKNIFTEYKNSRGMSVVNDWIDWLGGFPFEVASIEYIFNFFYTRGFKLINIKTTNSLGNNQYIFLKHS